MIYDVRQSTIYHYASPVAVAQPRAAADADRPAAPARARRRARRLARIRSSAAKGSDFFGNRITSVVLNQPHDTLDGEGRGADRRRARRPRPIR